MHFSHADTLKLKCFFLFVCILGNLNAFMLKEKDLRISIYSKREKISNAYLTVRNMTEFDRGLYTCRAENGIEMEKGKKYHEKSISVYVRGKIFDLISLFLLA